MIKSQNKRIVVLAVMLIISIGSFSRISVESDNIRTVEFLSIWVIGAFSGLLIRELITRFLKQE